MKEEQSITSDDEKGCALKEISTGRKT